MLRRLSVRNLAVVEVADADFGAGLNVITGETGAGKSVLMGALRLLMGGRAERSIIRTGENEASVTAVFEFETTDAINALLEEADIPSCEEGTLIIRRVIQLEGAGRIRINDTPATVAFLRQLAPFLADIHGPNDNLSLLDPKFQLELLTSYADAEEELTACQACWEKCVTLRKELATLAGDPAERNEEIETLTAALEEIRLIRPTEDDGDILIQQHAEAANAEEVLSLGNTLLAQLTDGENPISEKLIALQRLFHQLQALLPEAEQWSDTLDNVQSILQMLAQTMALRLSLIDADPEHLADLDRRLSAIQRLKRRYGPSLEEVLAYEKNAEARLHQLVHATGDILRLKEQLKQAEADYDIAAEKLHQKRIAAAPRLSAAITKELHDLGFSQASFPMSFTRGVNTAQGWDIVTFTFEPNPGEIARPLAAIASSGEIARVMLAVRVILAQHDAIPTLVFDEIDANIGGETSRYVGEKMRRLGQHSQILCITHQPQAAVYGHLHFRVYKSILNGRTQTQITALHVDERPEEIARMLGGADFTPSTLDHAREMLFAATGVVS
ncbi:MAG: DNA repair protein RecN [bacterium]|nr:DNA repair protein RecN [bacterium]